MDKKTGVLPMGLSMAKKPRNTVVKNKVRFGILFKISNSYEKMFLVISVSIINIDCIIISYSILS